MDNSNQGHGEIERPPLGIMPKYIHDELRLKAIMEYVNRMLGAVRPIEKFIIDEYNMLAKEARRREYEKKSVPKPYDVGNCTNTTGPED